VLCATYRFSGDIDFSAVTGGPESPNEVTATFTDIAHLPPASWAGHRATTP